MRRTIIVPKGLVYKKRIQTRVGGSYVPRYNKGLVAGGKKTAFRHVWHRRGEYRKGQFSFRITRDDGIVIDETTLRFYGQGIRILQKKDGYPEPTEISQLLMVASAHGMDEGDPEDLQYWTKTGDVWKYKDDSDLDYIVEFSYNTVTQIWTVPFRKGYKIRKKFWVVFICNDSIQSWYKVPADLSAPEYIYKEADFFNEDDLIKPKFYEVAMPYWKVIYENNNPTYVRYDDFSYMDCDDKIAGIADKPNFWGLLPPNQLHSRYYTSQNSFYKKVIVKSSIPYKIIEQLNSAGEHIGSFGYDPEGVIGSFWGTLPCPQLSALCIAYGATAVFQGTQIDVTYTSVDPPSSWDSVSETFNESPSIAGKTFTINVDLTSTEVPFYSYCWYDGNKYEQYSAHTLYRFTRNDEKISNTINIQAFVDYG